jgi:anti-anti-sigma factor
MASPTPQRALEASRVARSASRLDVAVRALDHAYGALPQDPGFANQLAVESEVLARELALRGASLGALGLWLRAQELGKDQAKNLGRLIKNYPAWRPTPSSVGAPKDTLIAGATGAFWVSTTTRARILVLSGGITGEGTEPFARVLKLACEDVEWVLIDLAKVNYIGSAGLAVAVKLSERLRKRSGGLALFELATNLTLLVETLGLDGYLNPVTTLADALERAGG